MDPPAADQAAGRQRALRESASEAATNPAARGPWAAAGARAERAARQEHACRWSRRRASSHTWEESRAKYHPRGPAQARVRRTLPRRTVGRLAPGHRHGPAATALAPDRGRDAERGAADVGGTLRLPRRAEAGRLLDQHADAPRGRLTPTAPTRAAITAPRRPAPRAESDR